MDTPAGHGTEVEVLRERPVRAEIPPLLSFHRSATQPQYPHTYPGMRCCRSNSNKEECHFSARPNHIQQYV